jgi:hypothetical protein
MPKKKLVIFGTRHWKKRDMPIEIKNALELIIAEVQPEVVLEEWTVTQPEESGAAAVSDSLGIPWRSIGTTDDAEFATFGYHRALDFPSSANIGEYGPFDVQEKRERIMRDNIVREMAASQKGVLVIGLAHLHSLSLKLANDFDVKSYAYHPEIF